MSTTREMIEIMLATIQRIDNNSDYYVSFENPNDPAESVVVAPRDVKFLNCEIPGSDQDRLSLQTHYAMVFLYQEGDTVIGQWEIRAPIEKEAVITPVDNRFRIEVRPDYRIGVSPIKK